LQLLVSCGCTEEAFQMARQTGEMALLGRLLAEEDATSLEEMRQVAKHFESEQDAFLAGKFYHLAGDELKRSRWRCRRRPPPTTSSSATRSSSSSAAMLMEFPR
jgi:hypothetical protein